MKLKSLIFIFLYIFFHNYKTVAQFANFEFAESIHSNFYYDLNGFERDTLGNFYLAGGFSKTADFNPGPDSVIVTSINNSEDLFILKLDSLGEFVWVKSFGSNYNDYAQSISLDKDRNIYVYGHYYGRIDVDPGIDSFYIGNVNQGYQSFIAKYNSDGDFIWAKNIGRLESYEGSIAVDKDGNVLIANQIRFLPGFETDIDSFFTSVQTIPQTYILKLDSAGEFMFCKKFDIDVFLPRPQIDLDLWGNIYLSGSFDDTVDFDLSTNTFEIPTTNHDGFILKLDSIGDFIWVKAMTGPGISSIINDLEIDTFGNIYTTGTFYGSTDFDPGPSSYILSDYYPGGNYGGDIFVQKLNSQGQFLWAINIGNNKTDVGNDLSVDQFGDVYVTGEFEGVLDFDPGPNVHNLTSGIYGSNIFLLKLSTLGSFQWAHTFYQPLADDQGYFIEVDKHQNIYANGQFRVSMDFDPGPGEYDIDPPLNYYAQYILKLNECYSSSIDYHTSCDSLTWINGITYHSSNYTAKHTLENSNGCDSIVHLSFTRLSHSTNVDVIQSCDKISWIDGVIYTESNNTSSYTLTNTYGCDSVITLDLTIGVEDISTTVIDSVISANLTNANYQWLDCDNGYSIIPGETSQFFSPSSNGNYAVEITQIGCIDTSFCQSISTISISENNYLKNVNLYPNPISKGFNIDLGSLQNVDMRLLNDIGQPLIVKKNLPTGVSKFNPNIPSGIYVIELNHNKFSHHIKLIKQ